MSSSARNARARRGRVLVVGDLPELASITAQLNQPPAKVANLFDALGEVSISPAGAPITTVLISDRCLDGNANRAIESLRKLDPSLRVVVIANANRSATSPGAGPSANGNAARWAEQGADECLTSPLRPEDVAKLFEEDLLATVNFAAQPPSRPQPSVEPPSHASMAASGTSARSSQKQYIVELELPAESAMGAGAPSHAPASHPQARHAQTQISDDPTKPRVIELVDHPPGETSAAPAAAAEQPSPSIAPARLETTGPLGDTDLVEAIMSGPGRLRPLALRLITQQTGWSDVAFIEHDQESVLIQSNIPRAAVASNDDSFGFLTSTSAELGQLQLWADWLARWLALDHAYHELRMQALKDDLTCAWNRRFFNAFLSQAIAQASKERRPVTVMVFDIDNFKTYNDQYGHQAGDEVLCETVRLLNSVIRQGDRVCRIGGDEFAVIFADPEAPREVGSTHPESVEMIAKRFQDQICSMRFPKLAGEAPGTLSISAGLATFPWDGHDPETLLRHADQLALQSKRSGKNAITFGPGARSMCDESTPPR